MIFVESEKATLALAALAERAGHRWLVVGLGGCYGWRARTGMETAGDGSHFATSGPHRDLDLIALQGREVVIAFDSNITSNPRVRRAEQRFGKLLQERGAKVRVARIPESQGVNGPDDFLAAFGDKAGLGIIDGASPIADGGRGMPPRKQHQ